MCNLKRWFLLLAGVSLAALLLVGILAIAPALAQGPGGMMGGYGPGGMMGQPGYGPGGMMGRGMMRGWAGQNGYGPGGMMGYTQGYSGTGTACPFGGPGMMGGFGPGMMGGFGPGMRGGGMMWNDNNPFVTTTALTVAEATEAVNAYLAQLADDNLQLGEIMLFDNQAYAAIVEKDSGTGAMELLVDPATKAVYPEMGPNMMWNLKYGMMGNRFGFGGAAAPDVAEMSLTSEEAVEAAQSYLDGLGNNLVASVDHVTPFSGYYTLDISQDGQVVGMLSVNGYSGQVFPHTWHGKLLEVSGE